jgi:YHS domain-containing protein/uncharacterized membrane protein
MRRDITVQMRRGAVVICAVLAVFAEVAAGAEPPRCPVMTDEFAVEEHSTEYDGRQVYFCCQRCRIRFTTEPEEYVGQLVSVGQGEAVDWSVIDASHTPAQISASPAQGGNTSARGSGVVDVFGRSHVVWVHFPIACLVIAGVMRLGVLLGGQEGKQGMGASGTLVVIGALCAVVTAGSGLLNPRGASFESMQGVLHETYERHELLGLVLAGLAVTALIVELWSVRVKSECGGVPAARQVAHALVVVCGALTVVVAHLGGTLVHGPGFLMP